MTMKKILKKNQIVITTLAVMVAIAGYLNYSGKLFPKSSNQAEETSADLANQELLDISQEDLQAENSDVESQDSEDNVDGTPGEAVLTNGKRMDISQYVQYSADPLKAGDSDVLIYYANQMYNDEEQLDTLYAAVDIKMNNAGTSAVNQKAKKQIASAKPSLSAKVGKKKAVLSWKKVSGASGYQIYRSSKKSSGFKSLKTISKAASVTYTDKSLSKGQTAYYKIRAYRSINRTKYYSKWSSVKNVKAQ